MHSIPERLSRAELDLGALHQEAHRLDLTLRELKRQIKREEDVKALSVAEETPPPLPLPKIETPKPKPKPKTAHIAAKIITVPVPLKKETLPLASTPSYSSDLELQLGRVWFVRLGIILLTTGLVFLSSYTYKNFIHDLDPGVRLTMLYLTTFILTGAGLFCERWKESLQNYGRIVAAGGLAAIYYTSYAAHNVSQLKVIDSPVLGSVLLLLTAGFCGGISLWRNSRLIMGASLALAFYSILLNPLGWMVSVSALVLTVGSVLVMRHKSWPELSYISLIGSYLSYAWWAFHNAGAASEMTHFLIIFWGLFTAISLLRKIPQHHLFASANHSLFFLLFSFDFSAVKWINNHWIFCLIFGAVLITLGIIGRSRFPKESVILHLTKGLGLITLGFILKLSGHQLFMTLLLQAVVLTAIHLRLKSQFPLIASWVIAALSALLLLELRLPTPVSAFAVTALLWGAYAMMQRFCATDLREQKVHPISIAGFIIAFLTLTFGVLSELDPSFASLILGGFGLITLAFEFRKIGLRFFSEAYWVSSAFATGALMTLALTSSNPLTFIVGAALSFTISFGHGRISGSFDLEEHTRKALKLIHFGFGILFIGLAIHQADFSSNLKMLLFLIVPVLGTTLSLKTKNQHHCVGAFFLHLGLLTHFTLTTGPLFFGVLIVIGHSFLLTRHHRHPDAKALCVLTFIIANILWFSTILSLYDRGDEILILFSWSGAGLLLLNRFYQRVLLSICAAPFLLVGILGASLPMFDSSHLYLGLIPLLAIHLFSSHRSASVKHQFIGGLALVMLWLAITRDLDGSGRAASWAILGTIGLLTGLVTKSRIFRIISIIILTFSLGHVMLIDIIKLDPLPRILSFITLGLGLLGLGFVYNRWGEKLKQIL